jgi:hypothetical protein
VSEPSNDWPIWIADCDGNDIAMRELAPGSEEYCEAAHALASGFQQIMRDLTREVRAHLMGATA